LFSFAVLPDSIAILDSFNATVLVVAAHGSIAPIRVGGRPEWHIEFVYSVHNTIAEVADGVNMEK
jgi:hypothetical protein